MKAQEAWRPHSAASDWEAAQFMPFPFFRTAGEMSGMSFGAHATQAIVDAQLMAFGLFQSYLAASRKAIDSWQAHVRDRQDAFMDGWRDQIGRVEAEEKRDLVEAEHAAARRRKSTQQSVDRPATDARHASKASVVAA